jgi:hypothetical protein
MLFYSYFNISATKNTFEQLNKNLHQKVQKKLEQNEKQ